MFQFLLNFANRFVPGMQRQLGKVLLFVFAGAAGCAFGALLTEGLWHTISQSVPEVHRPKVDVIFVVDITSSMFDEIAGVKDGINEFVAEFTERGMDGQVGLVAFGDRFEGEEPIVLNFGGATVTSDLDDFKRQVNALMLRGGGDIPESSFDALALAAEQPLRKDCVRIALLITDAPPKVPDVEIANARDLIQRLKGKFDQLHFVIRPDDRSRYANLHKGVPGEIFPLDKTAGFAGALTTIGGAVAEQTASSIASHGSYDINDSSKIGLIFLVWCGFLGSCLALFLIIGQFAYLRKQVIDRRTTYLGLAGGTAAGLITAIVVDQVLGDGIGVGWLGESARLMGWGLLGGLLGLGMAFVVPNLPKLKALVAGFLGGLSGGMAFLILGEVAGDLIGRVGGAAVLGGAIGAVVVLVEQIFREGSLVVSWGPQEQAIINLGEAPILAGSAPYADIYLDRTKGFPEEAVAIRLDKGIVYLDNKIKSETQELRHGSKITIGNVTIEVKLS